MADHIAAQQHHLAIHHERETRASQPDFSPESVSVHDGVNQRGEEDGENLKRLREFEPEEGHENQNRIVEKFEEGKLPTADYGDERP